MLELPTANCELSTLMATELDNTWWLEVNEVAEFERITRQEVYRRLKPGDDHPLIGKSGQSAVGSQQKTRRGTQIYWRSMTDKAQKRFEEERLARISAPNPQGPPTTKALDIPAPVSTTSGAGPAFAEGESAVGSRQSAEQKQLFPQTELDRKIAALDLPEQQRAVILGRFRAIRPLVNHDFKALGYASKEAYIRGAAPACAVSRNTVWRWFNQYMECEDLRALANEAPGPAATGIGSVALDVALDIDDQAISARAFIKDRWLAGDLKRQIYTKLLAYLTEKQRGCGVSYAYRFPSDTTVYRFIDSLDALAQAQRQGPEAVKAACGYIDRSYLDLHSLDVVECDECNLNLLSFDPRHRDKKVRWWVVTLYDERSIYPLDWDIVGGKDGAAKAHGITREDERRLFERLVREYGAPGCIHSDRGRFRGNFWGHEPGSRPRASGDPRRDAEFAANDGIFEALGIRRNLPREKNPRGTRLERFHGFLRDKARTLPGWIGKDVKEREMTRGDADWADHLRSVAGERSDTPLLSKQQTLELVGQWMEEWRAHPSDGTDMHGLSPRAVFIEQTPPGGFRRIAEPELALITSEYYSARKILEGGIVQLPDGKRYGVTGELTLLAGQKRDVTRSRDDHSFIKVLPLQKGQEIITAHRRARVGHDDPDLLAREMEAQRKLRNLAAAINAPLRTWDLEEGDSAVGSRQSAENPTPETRHPTPGSTPDDEISSTEWMTEKDCVQKINPRKFFED